MGKRSVRRSRKNSKKMYKQTGGAFTQEQRNTLINNVNFTEDQVNELDEYPVSFENIQSANHLYLDDPHRTMIIVSKYLQDLQNQQQNENDNHGDVLNIADLQIEGEVEGQEELPQTKILSKEGETLVKSGAGKMYNITKVNEGKLKLKEGRYDADLDKIEAAVKNATSFMNVGSELKKAGIKYDFTTSMIPMYMIKVSGNTIAICNKKYAAGAEREVKDMAIGLLN